MHASSYLHACTQRTNGCMHCVWAQVSMRLIAEQLDKSCSLFKPDPSSLSTSPGLLRAPTRTTSTFDVDATQRAGGACSRVTVEPGSYASGGGDTVEPAGWHESGEVGTALAIRQPAGRRQRSTPAWSISRRGSALFEPSQGSGARGQDPGARRQGAMASTELAFSTGLLGGAGVLPYAWRSLRSPASSCAPPAELSTPPPSPPPEDVAAGESTSAPRRPSAQQGSRTSCDASGTANVLPVTLRSLPRSHTFSLRRSHTGTRLRTMLGARPHRPDGAEHNWRTARVLQGGHRWWRSHLAERPASGLSWHRTVHLQERLTQWRHTLDVGPAAAPLPAAAAAVYVQGELKQKKVLLPPPSSRGPYAFHVYCSASNLGALELMAEVSEALGVQVVATDDQRVCSRCERMLVYLNSDTWTRGQPSEVFAAEVLRAMRLGMPLLPCHEMPGVGGQCERGGCEFVNFFACTEGATPQYLLKADIYSAIATPLKGGAWRAASMVMVGLALSEKVEARKAPRLIGKSKLAALRATGGLAFLARLETQQRLSSALVERADAEAAVNEAPAEERPAIEEAPPEEEREAAARQWCRVHGTRYEQEAAAHQGDEVDELAAEELPEEEEAVAAMKEAVVMMRADPAEATQEKEQQREEQQQQRRRQQHKQRQQQQRQVELPNAREAMAPGLVSSLKRRAAGPAARVLPRAVSSRPQGDTTRAAGEVHNGDGESLGPNGGADEPPPTCPHVHHTPVLSFADDMAAMAPLGATQGDHIATMADHIATKADHISSRKACEGLTGRCPAAIQPASPSDETTTASAAAVDVAACHRVVCPITLEDTTMAHPTTAPVAVAVASTAEAIRSEAVLQLDRSADETSPAGRFASAGAPASAKLASNAMQMADEAKARAEASWRGAEDERRALADERGQLDALRTQASHALERSHEVAREAEAQMALMRATLDEQRTLLKQVKAKAVEEQRQAALVSRKLLERPTTRPVCDVLAGGQQCWASVAQRHPQLTAHFERDGAAAGPGDPTASTSSSPGLPISASSSLAEEMHCRGLLCSPAGGSMGHAVRTASGGVVPARLGTAGGADAGLLRRENEMLKDKLKQLKWQLAIKLRIKDEEKIQALEKLVQMSSLSVPDEIIQRDAAERPLDLDGS